MIINNGGDAYSKMGIPNNGEQRYSVSGDVEKPGNYEVRLGHLCRTFEASRWHER